MRTIKIPAGLDPVGKYLTLITPRKIDSEKMFDSFRSYFKNFHFFDRNLSTKVTDENLVLRERTSYYVGVFMITKNVPLKELVNSIEEDGWMSCGINGLMLYWGNKKEEHYTGWHLSLDPKLQGFACIQKNQKESNFYWTGYISGADHRGDYLIMFKKKGFFRQIIDLVKSIWTHDSVCLSFYKY
jgi:hypothetical protein